MSKVYVNSYTELKEVPFKATTVTNTEVIGYIDGTKYNNEVKAAAMVFFRNESGNGKYGINNNFCGIQADSGRWNDKYYPHFVGVVHKVDGNKDYRWFIAFDKWQSCIDMILDKIQQRGVYIGGFAAKYAQAKINTISDLVTAYHQEWIEGSHVLSKPITATDFTDFVSMYTQSINYFNRKK